MEEALSEDSDRRDHKERERVTIAEKEDEKHETNDPRSSPVSLVAPVDRQKSCPFLLRVFCNEGGHQHLDEYNPSQGRLPSPEFQIYTWFVYFYDQNNSNTTTRPDVTIREIIGLIQAVHPLARDFRMLLSFRIISPIYKTTQYKSRPIGTFPARRRRAGQMRPAQDTHVKRKIMDTAQLGSLRFEIGDFLDVALLYPHQRRPRPF